MKKLILVVLFVLTSLSPLGAEVNIPKSSSFPVRDFSLRGRLFSVLDQIAEKYHIVIGVYGNFAGYSEPAIDISVKAGTLKDVFNAIANTDPQLKWHETNDGAIHFVTWRKPLSLMTVMVTSFDANDQEVADIDTLINHIPAVHSWLLAHKCPTKTSVLNTGASPKESWISVHVRKVPLYTVYDEIAAKSHAYSWSVMEMGAQSCAIYTKWQGLDVADENSPASPVPLVRP